MCTTLLHDVIGGPGGAVVVVVVSSTAVVSGEISLEAAASVVPAPLELQPADAASRAVAAAHSPIRQIIPRDRLVTAPQRRGTVPPIGGTNRSVAG